MQAWMKAGLIGATLAIIFTLFSRALYFIPGGGNTIVYLITCIPFLVIYPATGVLSAFWMPSPKTIRQGVKAGVLAGLIMGILDTIFSVLLDVIFQITGASEQYFQLQESSNQVLAYVFYTGTLICWGLLWLGLGVFLSGLGGLTYAALNKQPAVKEESSP